MAIKTLPLIDNGGHRSSFIICATLAASTSILENTVTLKTLLTYEKIIFIIKKLFPRLFIKYIVEVALLITDNHNEG